MSARPTRRLAAGVIAIGGTVAMGALSQVPYAAERAEHAVVRLAWRLRGEPVRQCRRPSPEELAKVPAHMRQEEVCERRVPPYRLRVTLDDSVVVDAPVRAGGAKQDRPLYVFQDLPVSPGDHRVSVRFTQETPVAEGGGEPPRLTLDTILALEPRRVLLVTYDEQREQLVIRGGSVE